MNVLVAVNDSPDAEVCLREVAARAWSPGTEIRVLSVAPGLTAAPLPAAGVPPALTAAVPLPPPAPPNELVGDTTEAARRVASRAMEVLCARGLNVRMRVRHGGAGGEIVEEACEWPADLVVLGTRDRGMFKRALLGSVADYVMHHAPCSVEVVRARRTR